jgi:hypothetical protein
MMPDSGEWRTYRSSTTLLNSGIYTGRLIETSGDFMKLLKGNNDLHKLSALKIQCDTNCYQDKITIETFSTVDK